MKDQKTLKEIYKKDMEGYWIRRNGEVDNKMVNYLIKKVAYIVELENNSYYVIDKPDIEKDFCFGYGYCGISTEEDSDRAHKAANYAATHEDYFLRKNLEGLDNMIKDLQDDNLEAYKFLNYCSQQSGSKLKSFRITRLGNNPEYAPGYWSNLRDLEMLTKEERQELVKGYEEVRKAFVKRLNTYLKRYGLSKVRTWTYLSD